MFTDAYFIGLCIEWFLYGLYSGIFAIYLQRPQNKSRTASIIFYALCVLYVLSTVNIVIDLVANIPVTEKLESFTLYIPILQTILNGCCDFLAQCILIYRCWIVWGQTISVVIVPSFLAITFLVTWLAAAGATSFVQGQLLDTSWGGPPMVITSLTLSMTVNTLVTGLIVFKIFKVFLQVKAATASVERTLGTTAGGSNLRHVIFIIIESGMALLAVQLARFVLYVLYNLPSESESASDAYFIFITINEMFNGITPTIILLRVSMRLSFYDKESFIEAAGSLRFNNPQIDQNTHQRIGQERSEDISFNNPSNDPNTVHRMGRSTIQDLGEESESY